MDRTIELVNIWYKKLVKPDLNPEDVKALETSILEDAAPSLVRPPLEAGKITYSDGEHSRREAMLDFVLAASQCLTDRQLYSLTKAILANQYHAIIHSENGINYKPYDINTFLRNNDLARYLIMIEMGKIPAPQNEELPLTLPSHLKIIARSYSDVGLANLVNTIFIGGLEQFKLSYHGLSHIHLPAKVSPKQIEAIRKMDHDIISKLDDTPPKQPKWLRHPIVEKTPLAIETMFNYEGESKSTEASHSLSMRS